MWAISFFFNFHRFSNNYGSVENESLPDYATCFLFDGVVESLITVYFSFSIIFRLRRIWIWEGLLSNRWCDGKLLEFITSLWICDVEEISLVDQLQGGLEGWLLYDLAECKVGPVEEQMFGKASVYLVGRRNHIWILHILLPYSYDILSLPEAVFLGLLINFRGLLEMICEDAR